MLSMKAAISLFTWKLGSVDRDELGYVPEIMLNAGREGVLGGRRSNRSLVGMPESLTRRRNRWQTKICAAHVNSFARRGKQLQDGPTDRATSRYKYLK